MNHMVQSQLPTAQDVKSGRLQPTPQQIESDKRLARMFGDSNAIAAGNGFELKGVQGGKASRYRGDYYDPLSGKVIDGHLSSYAMHLYGSEDGKRDTAIYIPSDYERPRVANHQKPTATASVVTFFYKKLGNERNVTLAVFHVGKFNPIREGDRVRIGSTGGHGGDKPDYRHAHLEIYRGDVGLPTTLEERAKVRVKNFAGVFEPQQSK